MQLEWEPQLHQLSCLPANWDRKMWGFAFPAAASARLRDREVLEQILNMD